MRSSPVILLICAAAFALGPGQVQANPKRLGDAYRAFERGDFARARSIAAKIPSGRLQNEDYRLYVLAQSEYFEGAYESSRNHFRALADLRSSRFADLASWREADCLWALGNRQEAAQLYRRLRSKKSQGGEAAIADFRIARAEEDKDPKAAVSRYREFLKAHAGHRLEKEVDGRLVALGEGGLESLAPEARIQRGIDLIEAKHWEIALQELASLDTKVMDEDTKREHTFWLSMSLYKRRRHYEKAGRNFLSIYKDMGTPARSAEALFHGARALSRADFDTEAIEQYQRLVAEYPRSKWSPEAQFLSGWLEFNRGNYRKGLPYLVELQKRYSSSSFAEEANWYRGMSHFLLGEYKKAQPFFAKVAKQGGKEVGGKGRYWGARASELLDEKDAAKAEYRELVADYPFSWYALLSTKRLQDMGEKVGVFAKGKSSLGAIPEIKKPGKKSALLRDPAIVIARELIDAGLDSAAGYELRDRERRFLSRNSKRKAEALGILMETYRAAGNYNRPWMLAVVHGGNRALNREPKGMAKVWWEHAYPLAYREFVEKYRESSGLPEHFLYTIMRKESGFAPNTHSYADAQGLLQMIPPTTIQVVPHLGYEYTEDLLFDPEKNIESGAWYIGKLYEKFREQVPIGAGSFNSGPRAVMRWLKKNGERPLDEFVELVTYRQTRKYIKRTTETYARYRYLYAKEVFRLSLEVNADYLVNDIDY